MSAPAGRWNPAAQRRAAAALAGGWHTALGRACVLMSGRATIAQARKTAPRLWLLRVEGWEWEIQSDMPAARFRSLPGGISFTHTPVKGFPTMQAAQKEADAIVAAAREVTP